MKAKRGVSKVDVMIMLAMFAVLPAVFIPVWNRLNRRSPTLHCGTNLKGLGAAFMVYSYDYDGWYPQLRGTGPWEKDLGFDYDMLLPDFSPDGEQGSTPRSVTASWYLLVREVDVSPRSLVCPLSDQTAFDGRNPGNLDIVQLWDFGPTPHRHVSYAMHNPYGRFPSGGLNRASFAVAADMSPWFWEGDIQPAGAKNAPPQVIDFADPTTWPLGNTLSHTRLGTGPSDGQNVLYADGSTHYETRSDVGVRNDNIYTFWPTEDSPTEQDRRGGAAPVDRTPDNDAKSEEDSFLVL